MTSWRPDPSFYPSPRMAMKAPPEKLAYVAAFDPDRRKPDAIAVVDVDPQSPAYSSIVGTVEMPNIGDELHHFGWNACSSCLCPNAPHPHMERRYLIVPGLRSSRIHVLDTKPDPRKPKIVKVISPEDIAEKTGYTRAHTVHCGPGGIYVSALGNAEGKAPGGIFVMDQESFEPLGRWEVDRGPQQLGYDGWWHLGYDTMVTSEWGTPDTFENGLVPEILLGSKYGRRLHFWDFTKRKHLQEIDFGEEYQLVFELRPAHDPTKAYGFVNCVISLKDLSSSIWVWHRDGAKWAVRKIIDIPAEPADPDLLPPVLKGFNAVPPLVTDIDLSMDDRQLYVSCWGTGDLQQYDVSDPFDPKLTGKVRIGGIVSRAAHPGAKTDGAKTAGAKKGGSKNGALNGGPQMVEVSRDGRRVYFTNSLYGAVDPQFYPDGIDGWMVKLDVKPQGGMAFDPKFFIDWPKGHRPHQVRLDGGDCSSDSYCYP
ncbi:selenium-binding protein 1 [Rhizobiales bacterium GAS191]|jgi:selenium-binding protein 1|nr:selenium-binding protein 1 [Rhizobiales bacterium GAS113]SED59002.1 selenium-binding protein 1 [Rhizobiales bacterium GAS191]SEE77929.1 selenium-binding protein 1 [Rhizobiales bacterium GAS188]